MSIRQKIESFTLNQASSRRDMGGILLDTDPQTDTLVISCSGIVPENRIIYAMENSTREMPTNKLFICDTTSRWYYKGIKGITSSFDETIDVVKYITDNLNSSRICCIGTSGGGYMAMAIASLLKFDRVLALSPQTAISNKERCLIGDNRWQSNMDDINAICIPYDILTLVKNSIYTSYNVLYPSSDDLDRAHARRLDNLSNVALFEIDTDNHNVAQHLSSMNVLQSCLDAFIMSDKNDINSAVKRALSGCIITA